jgi:hypothetical protein
MSAIDIHPEELFDKLVDGSLSGDERVRLETHLAICDTCRFELSVRRDFHAELEALESLPPEPVLPVATRPRASSRGRRRRVMVWALSAAGLCIATGALASAVTGETPWRLIATLASDGAPAAPANPASTRPRSSRPALQRTRITEAPEPAPSPIHEAPALPSASESPAVPLSAARANAGTASAAELFESANHARAARDTARAVELYRLLQKRFPRSPEAELSRLTLATLLLHMGDARAALSAFDAYLASGARPLEAEAQVGRALSFRALGLRDQEVAAWKIVARHSPGSSYERRARERLSALGQP